MNSKNRINLLRVMRAVLAALLVVNAAFGVALAFTGHTPAFSAGTVVFLALVMCFQTFVIRRQRALDRPRPDYAAIARMEREVYGEASEEAEIMFAHAKLQARIAAFERRVQVAWCRSPLCPCGGSLPQHIRSPHYLPGYDAGGRTRH